MTSDEGPEPYPGTIIYFADETSTHMAVSYTHLVILVDGALTGTHLIGLHINHIVLLQIVDRRFKRCV